jgi:hypothetical protein
MSFTYLLVGNKSEGISSKKVSKLFKICIWRVFKQEVLVKIKNEAELDHH